MEENPLVDFSPAFEDYARHMTGLRERFGYPPRLATPSQVSQYSSLLSSVADPDPYVFGPPGSGFISQRFGSGSGSGSFYHQAKIVRKSLVPTALWLLFDFLSLKTDVNVPSKSKKQKT
jgi:hypothetical protein